MKYSGGLHGQCDGDLAIAIVLVSFLWDAKHAKEKRKVKNDRAGRLALYHQ